LYCDGELIVGETQNTHKIPATFCKAPIP